MDERKPSENLWIVRLAVALIFFVAGAVFATWIAQIPQVREKLSLSEGQIGLALLGISVGVIIGLTMAGNLIERFSSRRVTVIAGVLFCLSLILIAQAGDLLTLTLTLAINGFFNSITDVAMNTQAAEVERRWKKSIMSSFHAAFSVGGFAGALIASRFIEAQISLETHFTTMAGVFMLLVLIGMLPLIEIPGETDRKGGAAFRLPPRALWGLGAIAFACTIGEGSMGDWSALYLRDIVQTNETMATYGFAAYSIMMTLGRFSGDWIVAHIAPEKLVRGGGLLATVGMGIALLMPGFETALLGFALVGLGLATIIPLVFSAAGNLPDVPSGTGIAAVATIGYGGFLAGPPVIGILADFTSLRFALLVVAILTATILFTGTALRRAEK
jgi:MFS family permease